MGGRLGEWPQSSTHLVLHLVPLIRTSWALSILQLRWEEVWKEQSTLCWRSREGAEPSVLMPLSGWPAGSPQKAVTPRNRQPQGMVLLGEGEGWGGC